jgi:hypothetical protein
MFTPHARWDRALPQDKEVDLNQSVRVSSIIHNGRIEPKSFQWKNRTFDIEKINFFWKDSCGKETFHIFSIQTKIGTYEIAFSHQALKWHIRRLISP